MSESRQFRFTARHQLEASQMLDTVRQLLRQGNVSTLTIRSESGDIVLSLPLAASAIAGGVVVLTAPWLALLAALAGVLAKVNLDVTYDGPELNDDPQNGGSHD